MLILLLVIGLLFGSFFNVVGLRIPKKQSIVFPPSHCPRCEKRLQPLELIPVLSYLFQSGKCKGCGLPISPLYPLMEAATGLLFMLVYLEYGIGWETVLGILFVSLLVIITVSDMVYQLIPNRVLLPFFILFLVLRYLFPFEGSYAAHLLGMTGAFAFFLLLAVVTRGGIGGGDIKLYGVIGLFLPPSLLILTILLSSLFGSLYGLVLFLARRASRKTMVPYGPFIALGAIFSYLYGRSIVAWYLSMY